jgi:DNA-binding transcriptional ArsR family regulator
MADEHVVSDPRMLRGIAHPVRNRILAELSAAGPLRAADVAEQIGVPANQASFHLRQLAKYGLVEEAPELARDGRDRVWRMVHEHGLTVNLDDLEAAPGGRAAVNVFRRAATADAHALVESAYARRNDKRAHVMTADQAVRLTPDEARQFARELTDFVESWRERGTGRGAGDGAGTEAGDEVGRTTYRLLQVLQPYPEADS